MHEALRKLADGVTDEASFAGFLRKLSTARDEAERIDSSTESSRWSAGPSGWESTELSTFLEAAAACADDSRGAGPRRDENP